MDRNYGRRQLLRAALAGAAGLAGCGRPSAPATGGSPTAEPTGTTGTTGGASPTGTAELPARVGLETLATGLAAPLDVAFAPEADRRYVAEQGGRVLVHGPDGLRDEPFLDLGDAVEAGGEKGLLGVALHPEFAANRRVFVRYSAPPREGTPSGYSHTFVLAEFRATDDGLRARRGSERAVLEIPEPQGNHNAGDLAFGPEGLLYVAVGDGGAGGDQGRGHVEDWYGGVGGGNGQDVTENLLGSVLRVDVDGEASGAPSDRGASAGDYAVPGDNPLVGRDGLDEHYAWGLRNPWRMSFDRGTLYVGDVGQNRFEEVDVVEKGGNYGWNVREATHCYGASSCPDRTPGDVRGGEPLRDPVVEYPNARRSDAPVSGISVIGGYVYRGSAVPSLSGAYVFGDFAAEGRLFVATPRDDGLWPTRAVEVADGAKLRRLRSFGRHDGEVYVVAGGGLHRVVPAG